MAQGLATDRSSSRSYPEHQQQFLWLQSTAARSPVSQPCTPIQATTALRPPPLAQKRSAKHQVLGAGKETSQTPNRCRLTGPGGGLRAPRPQGGTTRWGCAHGCARGRTAASLFSPGPPQPRSLPPAPLPHSFLHPPHKGPAAPQRRAHKEPKRACNLVIVTLILPFPLFSHPHLSPIRTGRRLSAGEQMTLFMHTGSRAASWAGLGWRSPADPWRPQPSGSRSSERRPGAKPSRRRPKGSAAPQRPHTAPGRHRPRLEARPRAPRRRHLGAVPRCHTQSGPPGGERGASVPHPNPSPSAR